MELQIDMKVKNNKQGFVELIILLLVAAIAIGGFFAYKYFTTNEELSDIKTEQIDVAKELLKQSDELKESITKRSEDTEAKTNLTIIATQLEIYFNENGNYPSLESLVDSSWSGNKGALIKSFSDSNGYRVGTENSVYKYAPTPSGCSTECLSFTLGTNLSGGEEYRKDSLN